MKEGLEKDTKKVDSLTVKDGETNSEVGKKKGKEERPPTKVVVRRLPPTMTEEEFLQQIEPLPPVDYKYYVPADTSLSPNSFCRAYLNFVNQSDIFIFTQKFDGYVFVDSKGLEYPAVVEFAPFQRIPKQRPGRKKDPKAGTLESDTMYTTFLEKLHAQIQETTSAGSNMKQHFFETNVNSGEDSKVSSTPLLDYLRTRHAERLRAREEKRKKDLERKRAREEQRRSAKKSEEEQAVLKLPVISLKPKTEDERLMEQQTTFLRKLLGLPNPYNPVVRANCSNIVDDRNCEYNDSYSERMTRSSENDQIMSRRDISLNLRNSFYSNYMNNYPYSCKPKYSCVNRNSEIKAYFSNGYWKRKMFFSERTKTRKLWKQPESNYESPFRARVNFSSKHTANNKFEDISTKGLNDQFRLKDNNIEKVLLDESALEAFPTFEESKLHKLQKSFLKRPLLHRSPIKKESLEDIKMKFQKWSHDVTTKTSLYKKKDSKKNDTTQLKIMKPPSRFIRNGINRMMRENDESRLELIYESILNDDMKGALNKKTNVNTKSCNNDLDYFPDGFKSSVNSCSVSEVVSQDKNNYSNCNSRFLIPNNLKLPKAFGSGKKMISHNGFSASSNLSKKSETITNDGLPKAFNSLLKSDNQKRNCHLLHRNVSVIGSSKESSSNDNINRKGPPCSIIC